MNPSTPVRIPLSSETERRVVVHTRIRNALRELSYNLGKPMSSILWEAVCEYWLKRFDRKKLMKHLGDEQ